MGYILPNTGKHCRWCGIYYAAKKPVGRDGFHSAGCKQAHHRAYKKWVTARPASADHAAGGSKRKK